MKVRLSTLNTNFHFPFSWFHCIALLAALSACDNSDPVLADSDGGHLIRTADTWSKSPEGDQRVGQDEDDKPENSTFGTRVRIHFSPEPVITNPLDDNEVTVRSNSGHVIIESLASGVEYEISGSTADGSVKIYSDKKFRLVLNGADITNPTGPAINIQSKKRAFVVLPQGSETRLTDGASYAVSPDEDAKGTLFSEGQMIFTGTGKLVVKGNSRHAIVSDDYIRLIDSEITVTSAVKDAIHTNDALIIDGGILSLTSTDDGIQCEEGHIIINDGMIQINSGGKAITASYDTDSKVDPFVTINGGNFVINSKDEGIESKSVLTINAGNIEIDAIDDALNAGKFIYINGGNIYARSMRNDGIDSNGPITITGGTVVAVGAGNPEGGIDCDRSTFKITGGVVVGIGGNTSAPTPSVSMQRSLIMGGTSSGVLISIIGNDGSEALTFLAPTNYNTMLFSSPKLEANKTYSVYTGGSVSSAENFHALFTSGTYEPGTKTNVSFTTSNMVTMIGGSTGPGGR